MKRDNTNPITYFVNPEKRTVVARMDNLHTELMQAVRKDIARSAIGINADSLTYDFALIFERAARMSNIPKCLVQKAVCSPTDIWDEEEGKRIAKIRLLKSAVKLKFIFIMNVADILSKIHNQLCERLDLYDSINEMYFTQLQANTYAPSDSDE